MARILIADRRGRWLWSCAVEPQPDIADIIRDTLGEPKTIRFIEVWGPRMVAEVTMPEEMVFIKAAADGDIGAEVAALGLAKEADVPVPRVLATGVDPRVPGGRWFAMTKAQGVFWSFDDQALTARIVPDIGRWFARLHQVRPDGFGPLDAAGRGTYDSWLAWILRSAGAYLDALVDAGHASDSFRTMAIRVFERATPALERGSLVHGDLGNMETFVDPERSVVTGIVDWGNSIVGDPVFEFAKVVGGGPADDPRPPVVLPPLLDRYVDETGMEQAWIDRILWLYQAHNAIFNADWCRREGVPWVDGLLAAADTWLREV
jgi:aminoglycoside phosphotransferase (APT) family kinase protein